MSASNPASCAHDRRSPSPLLYGGSLYEGADTFLPLQYRWYDRDSRLLFLYAHSTTLHTRHSFQLFLYDVNKLQPGCRAPPKQRQYLRRHRRLTIRGGRCRTTHHLPKFTKPSTRRPQSTERSATQARALPNTAFKLRIETMPIRRLNVHSYTQSLTGRARAPPIELNCHPYTIRHPDRGAVFSGPVFVLPPSRWRAGGPWLGTVFGGLGYGGPGCGQGPNMGYLSASANPNFGV